MEEVSKVRSLKRCREDTENVPVIGMRTVSTGRSVFIGDSVHTPYTGDTCK